MHDRFVWFSNGDNTPDTRRDLVAHPLPPSPPHIRPAGNTLWVDAVYGDDSRASREDGGRPFATLTAAKNAAQAGDLVVVRPGTYDENDLLKDGVNWHFAAGAAVDYTGPGDAGIFDDSSYGAGGAVACRVTGHGTFRWRGSSTNYFTDETQYTPHNAVSVTNAGSDVSVEGDLLYAEWTRSAGAAGNNFVSLARQTAGRLALRFRRGTGHATGGIVFGVWWTGGELFQDVAHLDTPKAPLYPAYSGAAEAGNAWVTADLIELLNTGNAGFPPALYFSSLGATTGGVGVWITAKEVRCPVEVSPSSGDKFYLTAQKLSSGVATAVPPLVIQQNVQAWVTLQKLEVKTAMCTVNPSGAAGRAEVSIDHVENTGTVSAGLSCVALGGDARLRVGRLVTSAGTASGLRFTGGSPTFSGRVDASASASGNPVVAASSGGALDGRALVAAAGRDSVTASAARTVKVYGTVVANTDKNVNVTLQANTGGFVVSADVT